MKLYIWNDPINISWGDSKLIVVADDLESAKTLALSKAAKLLAFSEFEKSKTDSEYAQIDNPDFKLGDPVRVYDLPCAEWDYWCL